MKSKREVEVILCDICGVVVSGKLSCKLCGKDLCRRHTLNISSKAPGWNNKRDLVFDMFCAEHLTTDLLEALIETGIHDPYKKLLEQKMTNPSKR